MGVLISFSRCIVVLLEKTFHSNVIYKLPKQLIIIIIIITIIIIIIIIIMIITTIAIIKHIIIDVLGAYQEKHYIVFKNS